ncbi:MAG: ABC transporter ATP-binding protein [Fimbriimonadaceae bacterium]|nr:ABC transporter ATP-binding protein [Fimbriimonadaceae bacterium]
MPDYAVEVSGLAVGRNGRACVSGVSFALAKGRFLAVVGENGSGKSTLLFTLARQLPPLAGTVVVDGRDIAAYDRRALARVVALVPQVSPPSFGFTVREAVLAGRFAHSPGVIETEQDHEVARRAMEQTDCLHLAEKRLDQVSGGEAQRVAVARALAQEPRVLLLDEPTTHLDWRHQRAVGRLARAAVSQGIAVVAAVHDVGWALDYADDALVLGQGAVLAYGPASTALAAPVLEQAYGVPVMTTDTPYGPRPVVAP